MFPPITLSLYKAREGFRPTFDCFEGIVTIKDFLSGFVREENSDKLSFEDKCQRNVSLNDSRVKGIYNYLPSDPSEETGFTGIIIFVNTANVVQEIQIGSEVAVALGIPATASRHVMDGQGRHAAFTKKLAALQEEGDQLKIDEFLRRTLGLKLIVTNTPHVKDVKQVIRKFFADVHLNLKKPPTTLSLLFADNPLSRFMRDLSMSIIVSEKPLYERLVVHGRTERGHITDYGQFRSLVCKSLGAGPAKAEVILDDPEAYRSWLAILTKLIGAAYSHIDVSKVDTDEWGASHQKAVFSKALFTTALGMAIRTMIEASSLSKRKIDYQRFNALSDLPLNDLSDPLWTERGVSQIDSNGTVKIVPKCAKEISLILCDSLGLSSANNNG